jgi:hypothetical protein
METWKEVKNFEGRYWVSSLGRLKSHDLRKNTIKILPCWIDSTGYYHATLRKNPLKRSVRIHTLVAEHFLTNPYLTVRQTVNHKDGNKLNNNIKNLEWCSAGDNCHHAARLGLMAKGSHHSQSKLNEKQVVKIRELFSQGSFTQKALGMKFGVSRRSIGDIVNRKLWLHV